MPRDRNATAFQAWPAPAPQVASAGPSVPSQLGIQTARYHLVDIENLMGSGRLTPTDVKACYAAYRATGLLRCDIDLIVLACNPFIGFDVGKAWPDALLKVGHGPDGADRELLMHVSHDKVPQRFNHVVIASGDGAFVEPACRLAADGRTVTVLSRSASLSKPLRLAAHHVVEFPEDTAPPSPHARQAA